MAPTEMQALFDPPPGSIADLESWRDMFRAALLAPSGMAAVAQLLRYVYYVCPELQYREFVRRYASNCRRARKPS